jgi:hypothetical protein
MKNLFLLPTDKPSILYEGNLGKPVTIQSASAQLKKPLNIYITSDEEIKRGDILKIPCGVGKVKELHWKYGNDNPSYIVEDLFVYKLRYGQNEDKLQINLFRHEDVKKIILTTDQDLIKDGVQAIDDEFLEWFVKNSSCERVEIDDINNKWHKENGSIVSVSVYKIIIPKEEPKQDWYCPKCQSYVSSESVTFEETHQICNTSVVIEEPKQECLVTKSIQLDAELAYKSLPKQELKEETTSEGFHRIYKELDYREFDFGSFKIGVEWQKEQDKKLYSEEEVVSFIHKFLKEHQPQLPYLLGGINMWFGQYKKQFKKK